MRLLKIRAVPLPTGETKYKELSYDYSLGFGKGLNLSSAVEIADDKIKQAILKNAALVAFSEAGGCPLSYKYKKGDKTFFEVFVSEKKVRWKYAFYTGDAS